MSESEMMVGGGCRSEGGQTEGRPPNTSPAPSDPERSTAARQDPERPQPRRSGPTASKTVWSSIVDCSMAASSSPTRPSVRKRGPISAVGPSNVPGLTSTRAHMRPSWLSLGRHPLDTRAEAPYRSSSRPSVTRALHGTGWAAYGVERPSWGERELCVSLPGRPIPLLPLAPRPCIGLAALVVTRDTQTLTTGPNPVTHGCLQSLSSLPGPWLPLPPPPSTAHLSLSPPSPLSPLSRASLSRSPLAVYGSLNPLAPPTRLAVATSLPPLEHASPPRPRRLPPPRHDPRVRPPHRHHRARASNTRQAKVPRWTYVHASSASSFTATLMSVRSLSPPLTTPLVLSPSSLHPSRPFIRLVPLQSTTGSACLSASRTVVCRSESRLLECRARRRGTGGTRRSQSPNPLFGPHSSRLLVPLADLPPRRSSLP